MKKIFLFAAIVAAMTVNAKVISFAGIVDNSSADAAKAAFDAGFDFENITTVGVANSSGDSYLVEVIQTSATEDWETTSLELKADNQVYFAIKDNNNDKLVIKAYQEYIQPNGKAVCLVITDLNVGDKVKLTLNKALNKEAMIEGATVASDNFASTEVELTAAAEEIRVYSKSEANSEAKWQLVSVEVPGATGVDNVFEGAKAQKVIRNGQVVIMRNGVAYTVLGSIAE